MSARKVLGLINSNQSIAMATRGVRATRLQTSLGKRARAVGVGLGGSVGVGGWAGGKRWWWWWWCGRMSVSFWTRPLKIPKAHRRDDELPTPQDQAALSGPSAPVAAKHNAREPNLSMNCHCGASAVSAHQRHPDNLTRTVLWNLRLLHSLHALHVLASVHSLHCTYTSL